MANLLERTSRGFSSLTATQFLIDGIASRAFEEVADLRNMAPMLIAGAGFRLGRLGVLACASQSSTGLVRGISYGVGLLTEATAFEWTSKILHPDFQQNSYKGIVANLIRFGILRSSGSLGKFSNPFLNHFLSSAAMVGGEHIAASVGLASLTSKSLFEEFVAAGTMNAQMLFSTAGLHLLFPSISHLEKSLDLSLQAREKISSDIPFARSVFQVEIFAAGEKGNDKFFWWPRTGILAPKEAREMASVWRRLRTSFQKVEALFENPVSRAQVQELSPDPKDVNQVWFHQVKDFVTKSGGTWHMRSSHCLLEPILPKQRDLSTNVLEASLTRLRERGLVGIAEQVLEFEIPYEGVAFGIEGLENHNTELSYVLGMIEGNLENSVRLVGNPRSQGKIIGRIPSLLLLESLQETIARERFTPFVYVQGKISRDLITRMRSQGYAPIGLSRTALLLGDIKTKVHPWFFALHDVYHALGLSEYPENFRRFIGEHYERLKTTPFFSSPFMESHLDRLVDFDPTQSRDGKTVNYLAYSLDYVIERLHENDPDAQTLLARLVMQQQLWIDYLAWMNTSMPCRLALAPLHEDLRNEVNNLVENLQQVQEGAMREIRRRRP